MNHSIEFRRLAPRKRAAVLAALVLLLACSEPAGPERQGQVDLSRPAAGTTSSLTNELAAHADRFVDAISVGTHLEREAYAQKWSTVVRPRLLELGVRHIRQESSSSAKAWAKFQDLYHTGRITLTALCSPTSETNLSSASHCISRANAIGDSVVDSWDGWNEVDNKLTSSTWPAGWLRWQTTLYNAKAGIWADEPLYASSLAHVKSADQLGNWSSILDHGNMHSYPGTDMPSVVSQSWIPKWTNVANPKPLVATETGYHNCIPCPSPGISYLAGGKYIPRLTLEYWNRGVVRTSLYQFMDTGSDPNVHRENNWGLVKYDGSVKPAFTALKNLIALLSDKGPSFAPGKLDYSLSGVLSTTHHTLLQKRDGRFYLALWQEVKSWDNRSKKDITNPDDAVTLTLAQPASALKVFRPLTGPGAIQTGRGTSIALSVPDEVIVVEVTP